MAEDKEENISAGIPSKIQSSSEESDIASVSNERKLWCVSRTRVPSKSKVLCIQYCSSIDVLFIVMEDGSAFIMDSSCETEPFGPIPLFKPVDSSEGPPIVRYIKDGDCLVLLQGDALSCRHTYSGTLLLQTALNTKPNAEQQTQVNLEFTVAEGQKLTEFIKANDSTASSSDKELAKKMFKLLEQADRSESSKWMTYVINGTLSSLGTWLCGILDVAKDTGAEHAIPVVSALIERLNQQKTQPYSFELTSDGNGLDKCVMVSEAARRMTFTHWPHMNYKWALPDAMAEAGFYHQPNTTGDDRVLCFMCSVCLVCWEPSDEPWSEHERHTPNCPFVRGDSTCNVPVNVSLSALPTVQVQLPRRIVCISTVSNSHWLAVSSDMGHIQLYNTNALPQQAVNYVIDLNDAYLCMKTGYMHEPRKPPRVKWSDDACEPTMSSADAVVATTVREVISDITNAEIVSELKYLMMPSQEDVQVNCLSIVGRGGVPAKCTEDAMAGCSLLLVGAAFDQARLRPNQPVSTSIVHNMNTVNSCETSDGGNLIGETRKFHPFLLVYAIEETGVKATASSRKSNVAKRRSDGSTVLGTEVNVNSVIETMDAFSELSDDNMDVMDEGWPIVGDESATQPGYTMDVIDSKNSLLSHSAHPAGSDLLQVQYEPPSATMLLLHCLRLPSSFDKPGMLIHSIVPCSAGLHVLVTVNSSDSNMSALLVYPINFTGSMPELGEVASREHVLRGLQAVSVQPICPEGISVFAADQMDWLAFVSQDGDLRVIDLDTGITVSTVLKPDYQSDPYISVTQSSTTDRICVATREGCMRTVQIQELCGQANHSVLETCVKQLTTEPIAVENNPLLDQENDLLTKGELNEGRLLELWQITRTEWQICAQFAAIVPSCFSEILQQQRQRKNPQHYLKENRHTRSWHIQPDSNWQEHMIDMSVASSVSVSHIDFKFCLHALCAGVPNIEVTLLRKKSQNEREPCESDIPEELRGMSNRCLQLPFLKQYRVEIVAGPVKLCDVVDFSDLSGLVQFASPGLHITGTRHYILHIQALSPESMSQKMWKQLHQDYLQRKQEAILDSKTQNNRLHQHLRERMKDYHSAGGFKEYPQSVKIKPPPFIKCTQRRSEDRKGCEWLDEVSVTVWCHCKTAVPKERLQRVLLYCSWSMHKRLLHVLSGDHLNNSAECGSITNHKLMIFDIISWLIPQWINTFSRDLLMSFGGALSECIEALMNECYLRSGRSIASRFTAMLSELLCGYKKLGSKPYHELIQTLTYAVRVTLRSTDRCHESSGLLWLLTLASHLSRADPYSCREITEECVLLLDKLSAEISNRNQSLHTTLAAKYGLTGLPLELEMFDWTPPVVHTLQQNVAPSSYATATNTPIMCPTVYFSSEVAGQDDMDWGEMLGINVGELVSDATVTPTNAPPAHSWFDNVANANVQKVTKKGKKKTALSREHIHGLLEVEPLTFICLSGSDGLKVENLETGLCSPVGNEHMSVSSGPGPIPLPDLVQSEGAGMSHPAMLSAVTSMKQQVQSILSKQMQLLALQQQKQKLQGKLDEHAAAALAGASVETQPGTQGSSASTFGVPTTPKTTPFMTPTPLSPSQLSPFSSEANLCFAEDNEVAQMLAAERKDLLPVNLMAPDILKQPPPQMLIVERLNSGGRKCVLLDLGRPVLLTDVLIPPCGDLNSVSIDVWMKEESVDGQRLVVCNDISTKALVVCDIQPPIFCRFVKLTYIGKHGLSTCVSKIPLGQFFGHRFLTPAQLDSCQMNLGAMERLMALQTPVSRRHLQQLSEDLRCKHRLAVSRLKTLISPDVSPQNDESLIRDLYKECMQIRLQWNVVRRVLDRIDRYMNLGERKLFDGWDMKCTDQLRCTAELVLNYLVRSCSYLAIDPLGRTQSSFLTMQSALQFFQQLCTLGAPRLQGTCTVWLLEHGCYAPWWGTFFAAVLDSFFANKSSTCPEANENVFLLMCFLAGQSVRAGNLNVILELMSYASSLAQDRSGALNIDRLTSCLLLISSCIDVATGFTGKKRPDRWAFLAAEYGPNGEERCDESSRDKRKKSYRYKTDSTKNTSKVKWEWEQTAEKAMQLMQQQYDETVALAEDIKQFVNGKTTTPPTGAPTTSKAKLGQLKASSRKKERSSSSKHPKKKSRRSRLRLPTDLCMTTARALLQLLVEQPAHLSSSTALVLVKVIAKISYESGQSLMLFMLVDSDETVEKLVSYALDCRQTPWLRHAITCLFIELAEIENKTYLSAASLPPVPTGNIPGHRYVVNTPMEEDWGSVPLTSSSTSSCNLSTPDTPAGAQQAIEVVIEALVPSPINKTVVDLETRSKELKSLAKCQMHQFLNSGGPFASINKIGTTAQLYEKKLAMSANSVKSYRISMSKIKNIQMHKNYMDLAGSLNVSSVAIDPQNLFWAAPPGFVGSSTPPTFPTSVHTIASLPLSTLNNNPAFNTYSYSFSSLASTAAGSSSGAFSEPAYAQAKEKLSKLCEQIQMTATPASVSSNFLFGTGGSSAVDPEPPPADDESGESRGGTPTEMGEADDAGNTSFSSEFGTLAAATEASSSFQAESAGAACSEFDVTRQLCIDIDLKKNVDLLQPVSFVLDERLECQMGWRAHANCVAWTRCDDTAFRAAIKQILPLSKAPSMPSSESSCTVSGSLVGSGVASLSRVLTKLISNLQSNSSPEYVHRVLSFCWAVACALKGSGQKYSNHLFVQMGLSLQLVPALNKLLEYLCNAFDISEQVWVLSFQLCAYTPGPSMLDCFDKLGRVMKRFVCAGFGPMLSVPSAGPAAVVAFKRLLNCLNQTCKIQPNALVLIKNLKSTVLSVLLETLNSNSSSCSLYGQQLDVISCLVEFIREEGVEKCGDDALLAETVFTFARVAHRFLSSHAMSGSSVTPGAANPRLCHMTRIPVDGANKELQQADRCDAVICNLLNCAAQACQANVSTDSEALVADVVLELKPECIQEILSALCLCFTEADALGDDTETPPEDFGAQMTPKTVGNWILQVAVALQGATRSNDVFLKCLVDFLARGDPLSTPFIFVLKRCLKTENDVAKFIQLGGSENVFDQLLVVSRTVADDDTVQCGLLKRIASVACQVLSSESGPPAKKPTIKVDGLTNFSPQCQISSSSPMAHQLQSLLSSNTPHRRARQATWTYHFYPAETWLDMTVTLPYPVLLSEIQIRPHAQSLQTGPSAVQVELGADNNPMCLNLVGPPVPTHGCSKIRITTDHFPHPVQMVKLHLKRPNDSANMGMTQVLVLGTAPLTSTPPASSSHRSGVDFMHWCNVLQHIMCNMPPDVCPATEHSQSMVAQRLVTLLLSAGLEKRVCCQLQSLLSTLSPTAPVLHSLLTFVDSASFIREDSVPWINDLLYTTLTHSHNQHDLEKIEKLFVCIRKHVGRAMTGAVPNALWSLVWSLSCILWKIGPNLDAKLISKHMDKKFINELCEISMGADVPVSTRDACAWLLCSLCSLQPSNLQILLSKFNNEPIVSKDTPVFNVDSVTPEMLTVLGMACQSDSAARYLHGQGVLHSISNHLLNLCLKKERRSTSLLSLLNFFCEASQVPFVRGWLVPPDSDKPEQYDGGGAFFLPLLRLVVSWTAENASSSSLVYENELQTAIVTLLRRCVCCDEGHQQALSASLCSVLADFSECGLHGALQEIVIATLLQDETVNVLVESFKSGQAVHNCIGMRHPQFGCARSHQVLSVPAFTTCKQLMSSYSQLVPRIFSGTFSELSSLSASAEPYADIPGFSKSVSVKDAGVSDLSQVLPDIIDLTTDDSLDNVASSSVPQLPPITNESPVSLIKSGISADLEKTIEAELAATLDFAQSKSGSSMSGATESASVSVSNSQCAMRPMNPDCAKVVCCVGVSEHAPLGRTTTVGQLLIASENAKSITGTSFIHLRLRPITPTELMKSAKDRPTFPDPPSTLQVFAKREGLALLAQHLQLYQPTFSLQPNKKRSGEKDAKETKMSAFPPGFSGFGPNPGSSAWASGAYDPNYYEDFEFMDYATGAIMPSEAGEPRVERLQSVLSAGLSPHVVVAFSVMLRLPAYAQLLVGRDRKQAQRLLRLAMGVSADPLAGNITGSDTGHLSLVPFDALASLYAQHNWNTEMGKLIRENSLDLGIVDILLACLAAFSHQSANSTNQSNDNSRESTPEHVRLVEQLLEALSVTELSMAGQQTVPPPNTSGDRSQQFWAKGTGFGTGSTTQQWNVDLHVVKRKLDEENVTCLLNVLASLLYPCNWAQLSSNKEDIMHIANQYIPEQLVYVMEKSCIVPTLAAYLRNDSVLDISRHTAVYEAALRSVAALALCPPMHKILTSVTCHDKSLSTMLLKFRDCIQVYVSKINPLEGQENKDEVSVEEGLMKLVPLLEKAVSVVTSCLDEESIAASSSTSDTANKSNAQMSFDQIYMNHLKPIQFETVNFFDETGGALKFAYHYESSVKGKEAGVSAPRVRRLAQESVTLSTSLPLSASSSVFVRAAEERLDVMKVMITGPEDTPYANGCFEFDVFFPTDYPNSPMHVNLQTTGGHSVRFNPNLYNDGKVCLSVLNTWHGRPEERWNPHTSSFLQVLVSIQSLILVPDPYFNEPGYERSRGTPGGQQASNEYDANIRQANVRWAMLEMLRRPPGPFKEMIQKHFWLKKHQICAQIEGWIEEMESTDKKCIRNIAGHLIQLKRHYTALKEEFRKLEPPEGMQPSTSDPSTSDPLISDPLISDPLISVPSIPQASISDLALSDPSIPTLEIEAMNEIEHLKIEDWD